MRISMNCQYFDRAGGCCNLDSRKKKFLGLISYRPICEGVYKLINLCADRKRYPRPKW